MILRGTFDMEVAICCYIIEVNFHPLGMTAYTDPGVMPAVLV